LPLVGIYLEHAMSDETQKKNTPPSGSGLKCVFVSVLIVALYVAHQDTWNWKKATPMVFGFLPPGLAYHAAYSVAAAALMALLVKIAWPKHLEEQEGKPRQ
jgi:hypothetical protein